MVRIPTGVYERKAAERNAAKALRDRYSKEGQAALAAMMDLRYKTLQAEIKKMFADPNVVIAGSAKQ